MRDLLFTLPRAQMKEVLNDYAKKVPAPLNTQFPDRQGKEEAVHAYRARKQQKMKTPLYPSGKFGVVISSCMGVKYCIICQSLSECSISFYYTL